MFILSFEQLRMLLNLSSSDERFGGDMIDIGAGDGEVTKPWIPIFDNVFATEISASMRSLLTQKRYQVLDTDKWWEEKKFKAICMLNLLDRCSNPIDMLNNAQHAMTDDGILIVALVLPFKPYVESTADHTPGEYLPLSGKTFEEQVESFVTFADQKLELELFRWSRVPYLCEGDISQSYYWLDDLIIVFKRKQH